MHSVLATPTFERHAKAAGLSDEDITAIAVHLAANPLAGDLIVGTGGARKMRLARRGQGKSGGYRTIHYFGGDDVPLFLLAVVDKGRRADLSQSERNALAKEMPLLVADYRSGVAARVIQLWKPPQ